MSRNSNWARLRRKIFLIFCLWGVVLVVWPWKAVGAVTISVEPTGKIQVVPASSSATGILEILEEKSGRCLKTLHAGTMQGASTFSLAMGRKLPPGRYRVRYRENLKLVFDCSLNLPNKEKWINPTDLVLTDKAIFVFDQGNDPEWKPGTPPRVVGAYGGSQSFIYKFHHDGKPDPSLGDMGRLGPLLSSPSWPTTGGIRTFAVDEGGLIYIGSVYHEALVYDSTGESMNMKVGGYAEGGGKTTTWVNSMAIGPGRRLYFPSCYGLFQVYDRTKTGFAGFLYGISMDKTNFTGLQRYIAADREESVCYIINRSGQVWKYEDTGKELKALYASDVADKMINPTGPSASAGQIWVADHGGPPLWDSDGNEICLFWDNGAGIQLVERFGGPGKADSEPAPAKAGDKAQFMNPSAAILTPDHLALWVVEDGLPNDEGPPGNARVRRFRIEAAQSAETIVDFSAEK
ncbi:MAG: hypothetical protein HY360_04790 [Verrucomicrobia bacterium]|nr:hypothetical protein [Verrucomicrobiota bacterium]